MTGRAPQVFISYQRSDEAFARQVREHLVAAGVQTWMDQYDIPVGAYWPDEIDKGLNASEIVIGVLSPDAIDSRNVKNEWDWALQNEKRLLLLQVVPCLIPHRYISINFIEATNADPSSALVSLSRALGSDAIGIQVESPAASQTVVAPVPIRHAPRVAGPTSRVAPFIAGREREQAILRSQLDNLLAGSGSLVLIGGEAGIGKTTLTRWLTVEAEARGAVVLTGGCYDLTTTPPYGPWVDIIRDWPEDRGLPPVPEALRGGEAMARLQSQIALFELVTDLLATAGAIKPVVQLLEDLHWADQPSLDLLRYLARLVAGFRIMLVVTYRDDEITRRHPLFGLLPALAREPGAERISLQRLAPDAIRDLIASRYALMANERARLAGYVQRVTEGNPFFAGEVLRALEESRAIEQDDAGWRLGDLDRVQVPDLVRQVIEGRLAHLGDDVHRQLQVAAVLGHEIPIDLWIAVSGEDEAVLSEVLDRATEARIVEELRGGDGFRFTHALIRETLYEGLGLLRRRTLHRRAGEELVAGTRPDPDVVAHHFSQAHDPRVFDWLIQAGDRAKRSYAWVIAAERYEQAAAMIADDPERARDYGWLLVGIAQMLRFADAPKAIRAMDEAATVGAAVGDGWLALWSAIQAGYYRIIDGRLHEGTDRMVAVGREMEVAFRDGRLDSWKPLAFVTEFPRPVFDYTLRMAAEWPDQAVVLTRSIAAVHLAHSGRFRDAQELTGQLARVWPPDLEEAQGVSLDGNWRNEFANVYIARAITEHGLGLPQQALQSAQVALRANTTMTHYFTIALTQSRILGILIAYHTEEIGQRRAAANDAADARSKAQGAMQSGSPLNTFSAPLLIVEGAWGDAYAMLHTFVFPREGASPMAGSAHNAMSELAVICAFQGRRAEALDVIRSMLPGGADTEPGDRPFHAALALHDVAASLALEIGDMTTAHAWLAAHDRWLAWSGAVLGQVEGHLGWARYHRQAGDLDAAEAQAHSAFEKASNPRQPLGLIASQRLLGELATERGNHESAATHLAASLALADTCAAPFERALTLVALAELEIVTGGDARENLATARAICEPLEARPTLDRVAALEAMLR